MSVKKRVSFQDLLTVMRKLFTWSSLARLIAAAFLVVALDRWSYDYYTLLRYVACGVATYSAVLAFSAGKRGWTWTLGVVALLFNPIKPVHLSREAWAPIDLAAALLFLISMFFVQHESPQRVEAQPSDSDDFTALKPSTIMPPSPGDTDNASESFTEKRRAPEKTPGGSHLQPPQSRHSSIVADKPPEELELERKQAELAMVEEELAQRELELATLRAELRAFEQTYLLVVGTRYAKLDEIAAQIAEVQARLSPEDARAREQARQARVKAEETARSVGAEPTGTWVTFKASDSLKKLYREVAKRIHPDLAADDADRARREQVMTEANSAYEAGDEDGLRTILHEWETSPESVKGEGTAAELVRVIRKIAQAEKRLSNIGTEIAELKESDLSQLKGKVEDAEARGRDLLAEMATHVDQELADARRTLQIIQRDKAGR